MKKIIFFMIIGMMLVLASCSDISDSVVNMDTESEQNVEIDENVDVSETENMAGAENEQIDLNYYNSLSCADEQYVYLVSYEKIIKYDRFSQKAEELYSAEHIFEAACYKDFLYFMQLFPVDEEGMITKLMRIDKSGDHVETIMEIDPACFELEIYDNILSLRLYKLGERLVSDYVYYRLDEVGNIVSEMNAEEACERSLSFVGYCIDPFYSLNAYEAVYTTEYISDAGKVRFEREDIDGTSSECNFEMQESYLLIDKNLVLYKNFSEQICISDLNTNIETVLYDNQSMQALDLLNYADDYVYFSLPEAESGQILYKLNIQNKTMEKVYELKSGAIDRVNIYGEYLFFSVIDEEESYWLFDML